MTRNFVLRSSACFTALVLGQSATADVTAQQVWDNWKDSMSIYGDSGITIGSEDQSGDTLTVTGLAINMADDDASVTADLGDLVFVENGDGTVSVTMADSYPLTITDEDGTTIAMSITQSGMNILASGDPDAINYDVAADQYTFAVDSITGPDGDVQGDIRFTMNDITGNYTVTAGDLRDITYDLAMASMDILVDVAAPSGDGTALISGKVEGLFVDAEMSLPADMDFENPEDLFASGIAVNANYGLQGGSYLFEFSEGNDAASGTVQTGSADVSLAFDVNRVTYGVLTKDIAVNAQVPDLPFPIDVSLAEYGINVDMPLSSTEDPTGFGFGLNLTNLAVNDEIWMMGDPSGQLPHDPITLKLALTGQARLFFDLLDPAQAEMVENAPVPGELHAITLDELDVRAAGAAIDGNGGFTFDNTDLTTFEGYPRPEGQITVNITGANALIDSLVNMGLLPEDQAMMARMGMGMFARTVGDDQLTSTIEINAQGHVLANGQRIQ